MSMTGNYDVLYFALIHFNKKGREIDGVFSPVLSILVVKHLDVRH
jgi:hypothetical protein